MEVTPEMEEVIGKHESKQIEVELEPETVQEKQNLPDLKFDPLDEAQLRGLQEIIDRLKALTNFGEKPHGHAR